MFIPHDLKALCTFFISPKSGIKSLFRNLSFTHESLSQVMFPAKLSASLYDGINTI